MACVGVGACVCVCVAASYPSRGYIWCFVWRRSLRWSPRSAILPVMPCSVSAFAGADLPVTMGDDFGGKLYLGKLVLSFPLPLTSYCFLLWARDRGCNTQMLPGMPRPLPRLHLRRCDFDIILSECAGDIPTQLACLVLASGRALEMMVKSVSFSFRESLFSRRETGNNASRSR